MVPDIPLFIPIFDYTQTHSILGLFTTCLPMGLIVFLIFEALLKQPLIALLPPTYMLRISGAGWNWEQNDASSALILLAALIFGAATHVFWDSFTHAGQWGVRQIPALAENYTIFGMSLAGYKLFQYGSSLLGLPILALTVVRSLVPVDANDRSPDRLRSGVRLRVWLMLAGLPMVVSAIAFQSSPSLQQAVFVSLTRSIAIMVGTIAVYAVLYRLGILTRPIE